MVLYARQLTWSREVRRHHWWRARRVPVWENAYLTPFPRSRPLLSLGSFPYLEAAMTPRKQKNLRQPSSAAALRVTRPHAAGIDVHAAVHWVAVSPADAPPPAANHPANLPAHVRSFGTCTADLIALADWLAQCGVTTIAMESTGIYWIPLFELLESRGFEVLLVDPRQSRHAPGRPKSDVLDCQWLQRLHSYGLLTASFRPADQVVVLRSYLRQRQMLIRYAGQHVQHMQKALEQMNVKLTEVVSDITGVTGMAIIEAILGGQRDPLTLAKLRHDHCKRTEAEIARALYGNWRAEHLFALKQAVTLYGFYRQQMQECDVQLQAHLATFADQSKGQARPKRQRRYVKRYVRPNEPGFDLGTALYQMSGVDLTVLEAINGTTALVILSEVGPDVSRFPTVKQFTSWLGLSPQHQGSAGKIRSRRVPRGANRAGRALRMAVQGCHHAKHALGAFYRRIQARVGAPKAIVATARKLAERVYRLLRYGEEYVCQQIEVYEAAYQARVVKGLARRAAELGYRLEPAMTAGT
jgi:transposase